MLGYTQEMLVTANEAKIEARDAGTTTTRRRQLTTEFSYSPEVLVLYRKRDEARRVRERGVFARFRYNDLKSGSRRSPVISSNPVSGSFSQLLGKLHKRLLFTTCSLHGGTMLGTGWPAHQ